MGNFFNVMNSSTNNSNDFVFENKEYTADCGEHVKEALRNRISIFDDQIIVLNDIPVLSPFALEVMMGEVSRKGRTLGAYGLIVDARKSSRPNSECRRKINELFDSLSNEITHISFCSGKNKFINTAAKFIMFQNTLKSFSFSSTMEEAVDDIKKVMNGSAA